MADNFENEKKKFINSLGDVNQSMKKASVDIKSSSDSIRKLAQDHAKTKGPKRAMEAGSSINTGVIELTKAVRDLSKQIKDLKDVNRVTAGSIKGFDDSFETGTKKFSKQMDDSLSGYSSTVSKGTKELSTSLDNMTTRLSSTMKMMTVATTKAGIAIKYGVEKSSMIAAKVWKNEIGRTMVLMAANPALGIGYAGAKMAGKGVKAVGRGLGKVDSAVSARAGSSESMMGSFVDILKNPLPGPVGDVVSQMLHLGFGGAKLAGRGAKAVGRGIAAPFKMAGRGVKKIGRGVGAIGKGAFNLGKKGFSAAGGGIAKFKNRPKASGASFVYDPESGSMNADFDTDSIAAHAGYGAAQAIEESRKATSGNPRDVTKNPEYATLLAAFKSALSGLDAQMSGGAMSVSILKRAFAYALPFWGMGYRADLPNPKRFGMLNAVLKTLGLIYVHSRFASDDNVLMLTQIAQILKTGLGVTGKLKKPKSRSLVEMAGAKIKEMAVEALQTQGGQDFIKGVTATFDKVTGGLLDKYGDKLNDFTATHAEFLGKIIEKTNKAPMTEKEQFKASPVLGTQVDLLTKIEKNTFLLYQLVNESRPKNKQLKYYAAGGIVTQPTNAIIGEAGPEAVVPLGGNKKPKAGLLGGLGGLMGGFFGGMFKKIGTYIREAIMGKGSDPKLGLMDKFKIWWSDWWNAETGDGDDKKFTNKIRLAFDSMIELKESLVDDVKATKGQGLLARMGDFFTNLPDRFSEAYQSVAEKITTSIGEETKASIANVLKGIWDKIIPEDLKNSINTLKKEWGEGWANWSLTWAQLSENIQGIITGFKDYGTKIYKPIQDAMKDEDKKGSWIGKLISAIPEAISVGYHEFVGFISDQFTNISGAVSSIGAIKDKVPMGEEIGREKRNLIETVISSLLPDRFAVPLISAIERISEIGGVVYRSIDGIIKFVTGQEGTEIEVFGEKVSLKSIWAQSGNGGISGVIEKAWKSLAAIGKVAGMPFLQLGQQLIQDAKVIRELYSKYKFQDFKTDMVETGKLMTKQWEATKEKLTELQGIVGGYGKPVPHAKAVKDAAYINKPTNVLVGEAGGEFIAGEEALKKAITYPLSKKLDEIIGLLEEAPMGGVAKKKSILRRLLGAFNNVGSSIWSLISGASGGVGKGIGGLAKGVGKGAGGLANAIAHAVGSVMKGIAQNTGKMLGLILDATKMVGKAVGGVVKGVGAIVGKIAGIGKFMLNKLNPFNWFKGPIAAAREKWDKLKKKVKDKVKAVFGGSETIGIGPGGEKVTTRYGPKRTYRLIRAFMMQQHELGSRILNVLEEGYQNRSNYTNPAWGVFVDKPKRVGSKSIFGKLKSAITGEDKKEKKGWFGNLLKMIGPELAVALPTLLATIVPAVVSALTVALPVIGVALGAIISYLIAKKFIKGMGGTEKVRKESFGKAVKGGYKTGKKWATSGWLGKAESAVGLKGVAGVVGGVGGSMFGAGMKNAISTYDFITGKKRKKMADGGIVTRPTNALIGEAGPEAVIPLKNVSISDAIGNSKGSKSGMSNIFKTIFNNSQLGMLFRLDKKLDKTVKPMIMRSLGSSDSSSFKNKIKSTFKTIWAYSPLAKLFRMSGDIMKHVRDSIKDIFKKIDFKKTIKSLFKLLLDSSPLGMLFKGAAKLKDFLSGNDQGTTNSSFSDFASNAYSNVSSAASSGGAGGAISALKNIMTGGAQLDTFKGLKIKGGASGQATSGGKGYQSKGLVSLAHVIQNSIPIDRFTGFNDYFHQGRQSKHNKGLALDFTIPGGKADAPNVAAQVAGIGQKAGIKLTVLDEYTRPSSGASGGHIHVNFPDEASANKFFAFYQKAQAGGGSIGGGGESGGGGASASWGGISSGPAKVTAPKQYQSAIASSAKKYGVSSNLMTAVFAKESGFNPNAKNKSGAAGMGQLMPKTAASLGLTGADVMNPEKNIDASTKYIGSMSKQFGGNPALALAAYNWGPGNLNKAMKKYGLTTSASTGQVLGMLKQEGITETYNYVSKILDNAGMGEAPMAVAKEKGPITDKNKIAEAHTKTAEAKSKKTGKSMGKEMGTSAGKEIGAATSAAVIANTKNVSSSPSSSTTIHNYSTAGRPSYEDPVFALMRGDLRGG